MTSADDPVLLHGGSRSVVHRRGNVVIRDAGPWTPAVHTLLRHLEDVGFAAAPRLVGSGLDTDGREVLTFIEGGFTQPGPWSLDGAAAVGSLLRDLHRATRSFCPPPDAVWFPWHGRDLGSPVKVIGHCDAAPWNIVARGGLPVALIDWETAGPVDPLVELAQLAWLNAKLHDDIVARLEHLPPLADRARQLAVIVDAYGLAARQRRGFLNQIIEFAICDTAWEADDAAITPETTAHPIALWAMAWRARSAAWMIRHHRTLETALTRGAPLENGGKLSYIEQSCYSIGMRPQVPRAKIRAQSPVLAVVLLAILVMVSAVLGWLGGLVAWLIVLAALAVFAFCLRARP